MITSNKDLEQVLAPNNQKLPNKNIKIPISPFGSYIVSGEMGKIGSNLKYWFAMEIMKKNIKINETIQRLTIFK